MAVQPPLLVTSGQIFFISGHSLVPEDSHCAFDFSNFCLISAYVCACFVAALTGLATILDVVTISPLPAAKSGRKYALLLYRKFCTSHDRNFIFCSCYGFITGCREDFYNKIKNNCVPPTSTVLPYHSRQNQVKLYFHVNFVINPVQLTKHVFGVISVTSGVTEPVHTLL